MARADPSVTRQALDVYNQLSVKHELLRLITPQFETPTPPLQPAVSQRGGRSGAADRRPRWDVTRAGSPQGVSLQLGITAECQYCFGVSLTESSNMGYWCAVGFATKYSMSNTRYGQMGTKYYCVSVTVGVKCELMIV